MHIPIHTLYKKKIKWKLEAGTSVPKLKYFIEVFICDCTVLWIGYLNVLKEKEIKPITLINLVNKAIF